MKEGIIDPSIVKELGSIIHDNTFKRAQKSDISIADLTGVAVQDIMIAKTVYLQYLNEK